jgi:hypothetical protein
VRFAMPLVTSGSESSEASGYDGTIKIDTSINTGHFNAGMTQVTKASTKVMKAIPSAFSKGMAKVAQIIKTVMSIVANSIVMVGIAAVAVIAVIEAVIGALIGIAIVIVQMGIKAFNVLDDSIGKTSEYYDKVKSLKDAFANLKGAALGAFMTLLTAALPYLIMVMDFLTKIINYLSMVLAAFLGQASVMQYVGDAAEIAAENAAQLAKNTKDAEKAAKGALAAFDELDVLQQEGKDQTAGTTTDATGMLFKEVPLDPEIVRKAEKVKQWFVDMWNSIVINAQTAWAEIVRIWGVVVDWFIWLWTTIRDNAWLAAGSVVSVFISLALWFKEHVVDPIIDYFAPMWAFISILAWDAFVTLKLIWETVSEWFRVTVVDPLVKIYTDGWNAIFGAARDTWAQIVQVWQAVVKWFSDTVVTPLQKLFGPALDWVREKWVTVFSFIASFVKGVLNGVIDAVNRMISMIASGLNSLIANLNTFGSNIPGWVNIPSVYAKQIPRLAKGAVIPPGSEFLAILGDQTSGRNIEAPENLIRQIIQEEVGKVQAEVTINFAGSLASLVRELKPFIDKENVRVGGSLVQSGVTS